MGTATASAAARVPERTSVAGNRDAGCRGVPGVNAGDDFYEPAWVTDRGVPERLLIPCHEAGRAVAYHHFGMPLDVVVIRADGSGGVHTLRCTAPVASRIIGLLAGEAQELIAARWGSVSALAQVLMARGWLNYSEVLQVLNMRARGLRRLTGL